MKIDRRFFLIGWISAIAYGFFSKLNAQPYNPAARGKIVINQIGYYPTGPKLAFLINAPNSENKQVELVDLITHKTVFVTNLGNSVSDKASNDKIRVIDFTKFDKSGSYYLKYGYSQSYPFGIGKQIYKDTFTKLLRSYYLQRCGVAVNDSVSGVKHPPCHLKDGIIAHNDEFHKAGDFKSAQGGWHNSGDFAKYVAPMTVTIGRLLSLYEQYPKLFRDNQLTIPESGNGRPDLLDEVKVGLDWLLKMQREDGAVYRKLSGKNWPGEILPNQDTQPRYTFGISTPETGKFAAVMAMAARVYTPFDKQLAQTYLQAAQKAWGFLRKQRSMKVDWQEGDDTGSGKYLFGEWDQQESLKTDQDDRFWAAVELYITTGKTSYEKYLAKTITAFDYGEFGWKDPSPLAMVNYLVQKQRKGSDKLKLEITARLMRRADSLMEKINRSGYRLAINKFHWASNHKIAEEGITLLYAYRITGNRGYYKAAVEQLDYLLGRNHFNLCFITGVGSNSVRHVHHRISRAKGIVIPGLMVGGPNTDAQDGIAPKGLGMLSYVDDERSWATNEYAIDNNASVIALMGMVMAQT
ncbi:glycoside hydrolase family 9 protein [Moorena bouillonii]|uniref:Endoglucanase n=1 Tax=Moorena bouillonii PNG TaxID=568701 RepID=A0A1U7N9K3_9CYAN|nr:glycoside hydrolase family 9 protein [Moorena bouillonii]OLT62623.1 glycosyl hydrolase family 5 [Moorena bouillonii PNG]